MTNWIKFCWEGCVSGMLSHSILGFEVFSSPLIPVTRASRICWKTNASFIAECPHNHTTPRCPAPRGSSVSFHSGVVLLLLWHVSGSFAPPFLAHVRLVDCFSLFLCRVLVNWWVMTSKGWVIGYGYLEERYDLNHNESRVLEGKGRLHLRKHCTYSDGNESVNCGWNIRWDGSNGIWEKMKSLGQFTAHQQMLNNGNQHSLSLEV